MNDFDDVSDAQKNILWGEFTDVDVNTNDVKQEKIEAVDSSLVTPIASDSIQTIGTLKCILPSEKCLFTQDQMDNFGIDQSNYLEMVQDSMAKMVLRAGFEAADVDTLQILGTICERFNGKFWTTALTSHLRRFQNTENGFSDTLTQTFALLDLDDPSVLLEFMRNYAK